MGCPAFDSEIPDLESVEYSFIAITLRSTLTRIVPVKGPIDLL